jgi:hypothetical protein
MKYQVKGLIKSQKRGNNQVVRLAPKSVIVTATNPVIALDRASRKVKFERVIEVREWQ